MSEKEAFDKNVEVKFNDIRVWVSEGRIGNVSLWIDGLCVYSEAKNQSGEVRENE